jgi:hypothetical protein
MAIGDRLISETTGVATLVLFTVVVTASVGVGVLFIDDSSGQVQANFTFEHRQESGSLLVTHAGGEDLTAGNVVFEGPRQNVTWAESAGWNESRTVSEGDVVQLSPQGAYGTRISQSDTITVVYLENDGNRTRLDDWTGGQDSQF